MKFHEMEQTDLLEATNTSMKQGLTEKEVKKRLDKHGPNELQEGKKTSALLLFFAQFKDFMVLVLLAATLISGFLGEYVDAVAIIAIVLVNGILGFFQERRAEQSLQALKELSTPHVMALREGSWIKIPSKDLVPGDIVKFTSGDRIGADVRIVEAKSLEIEESALTGESIPVVKHADKLKKPDVSLGDITNMAFMGTIVTRGSGVGVVVGTGMNTAMGKIADMLESAGTLSTPLQRRLEQLGKILIVVALLLTVLVVAVGVLQGHDLYTMFLAGVSLAVAAIPEGLPAIVTAALSLGVQRMIKQKSIVRKLPAVETLGCASIICSDKTGTLTQNKMTVTHVWSGGKTWRVTGAGYEPQGSFTLNEKEVSVNEHMPLQQMLLFGALCNNSNIEKRDGEYVLDGDPTEGALLTAARKGGFSKEFVESHYRVIEEFPFDSARKMMTVIVEDQDRKRYIVTKGAPDVLMQRSSRIYYDGSAALLTNERKAETESVLRHLASQALRTIAVAYRPIKTGETPSMEQAEKDLTLLGLSGIIDPPRPEVRQAIKECREAGIKTVMITGDHVETAKAIAKDLRLLPKSGKIMDGNMLNELSQEELSNVVEDVYVFARVSPEHKLKIVKAFQENGHIVAMTGDGVNDAPAIKQADIGVAMGITGTDVAKEASSLVLVDDNFATIKSAIKEGRNIYENIRKFIRYLLASNVGEILVMLFAMLLALPLPLVPIQILWVNLVTDGLPAMALGMDQPEGDVMRRKPRHPKEGVFARKLGWKVVSRGFLIGAATILAFVIVYHRNPENLAYAQTIAFATLVLAQLIHVFDCRSETSVFSRNPFQNMYLIGAVLSSILLMLVVIYYAPLQPIFHTVAITPGDWMLVIGMSAIPTFLLAGSLLTRKK
ncbi:calcium-translocating P-type ATPase, SERCA-type [Bacillus vallismortis]|uniref:calcium-translocating P-type ATPase, SERCA-type n=1 Tax=Bacillus vallismortis TaxID=72361 RepID=UPI0022801508|nr:calcium-translocating P-type ATPase, SERCA-type [Bacillus vallismortis]MCY8425707.1 calcium-translocating P-type ATPase, SERCA-type [Bacillus vallismortis]MCY8533112.1 calcium-translocating P-type ATPase, SERCA-type [Bacillus vallismortis]MCY8546588.1 calcium-translocating P-type ATPase, SERCA-type [Bacillus vallismortis]MEC1649630.1 calcium-translocating P-type ATPase, SERCA-type [Bacillus vallismortis]MEC1790298.1 calcium-translocating P-type ATPase, SERCA-type [Bacillus vallismortis]